MANPFSGLENIGASYMAGARLAQERQRRADEILARQEEARIRQQYYQDVIAEREAARADARKARFERAAGQFGQDVVLGPDGEIDYAASAKAAQTRQQTGQFAEAAGMLSGEGEAPGPLSPDILASPQFLKGRATTLGKRMAEQRATQRALMSAGYVPAVDETPPAFGLAPDLLTQPRDTSQDVMVDGQRFQPGPLARMRAMPKPAKPENLGTETVEVDGAKLRIPITPERAAEIAKKRSAAEPKEPGIFDDIDAAEKQLLTLQDKNVEDFNLVRNKDGNLEVVEDTAFAIGRTPEEIRKDLELERKRRAERRGIRTGAAAPSAIPQGTNRVIDFRSIPGLPPLGGR
jgi:hypothetical protein